MRASPAAKPLPGLGLASVVISFGAVVVYSDHCPEAI
jgi:hypothetical protein